MDKGQETRDKGGPTAGRPQQSSELTSSPFPVLKSFSPITLAEMSGVRLMNRTDTKYVLDDATLVRFLELASHDYFIQEVDGVRDAPYHTLYLDTSDHAMYLMHLCGRRTRQKVRVRTYEQSGESFFEVKCKNNKGRTVKHRVPVDERQGEWITKTGDWGKVSRYSAYNLQTLTPQIENHFRRITLVNRNKTERLTIDRDICFHNLSNDRRVRLDGLVVVELKRDSLMPSPASDLLHRLHVRRSGFSKYCMGCALTDPTLRQNRFRQRIRRISHMAYLCFE